MTTAAHARARRAGLALLLSSLACSASAVRAQQPARSELPDRLRISVRACASSAFDADAYQRLLRVELTALGIAEPDTAELDPQAPELVIASPDCDARLVLSLRGAQRTHDDALQLDDLPALGRERALALATVERLQRAWPSVTAVTGEEEPTSPARAPATAAPTAPSPSTAAPTAPTVTAAATTTVPVPEVDPAEARTDGLGALSVGLRFSTAAPLASVALNLDRTLSNRLALGGSLGWRSEHEGLAASTDAHSVVLGPRLELSLLSFDVFELAAAVGLEAGVGWVITARAGRPAARVSSSPAPLALAKGALGLRAQLAYGVFAQLGVSTDYALIGARFVSPGGQRLADLTGSRFAAFVGAGTHFGR